MKKWYATLVLTGITFILTAQLQATDSEIATPDNLFATGGLPLTPLFKYVIAQNGAFTDGFPYDSTQVNDTLQHYSCNFRIDPVLLVDSADVTGDGTKEWILRRSGTGYRTSFPPQPYGVGDERLTIVVYEVWNVEAKKQLFAYTSTYDYMIAVSTNVIRSSGFHFEVIPCKNGSLKITGNNAERSTEQGTYSYNREMGMYLRE